jgi:hypothetical protein
VAVVGSGVCWPGGTLPGGWLPRKTGGDDGLSLGDADGSALAEATGRDSVGVALGSTDPLGERLSVAGGETVGGVDPPPPPPPPDPADGEGPCDAGGRLPTAASVGLAAALAAVRVPGTVPGT